MSVANILSEQPAVVIANPEYISHRIDPNPFKPEYIYSDLKLDRYRYLGGDVSELQELLKKGKEGLSGGATPLGANYQNNGVRFIRTGEVNDCWIDGSSCVFISLEDDQSIQRSRLNQGDVLLTITGACFGRSAEVTATLLPANISQHSVRLRFIETLIPSFVVAYLNSETGQLQILKQTVGSTRQAIDYIGINKIRIPIPDSLIQHYIGQKLELAEECRIKASKGKNLLFKKLSKYIDEPSSTDTNKIGYWADEALTSERIDPMYYQPTYISNVNFLTSRSDSRFLDDKKICPLVTDGDHGNPVYSEKGPAYLRVTDFYGFNIQHKNMPRIDSKYAQRIGERCYVKKGDVIVSIVGTIGSVTVINGRSEGAIASRGVARIVTSSFFNPYYLAAYLASTRGQLYLKQLCVGTVQKGIYLDSLKKVQVPVLGKLIQDEIGNHLKEHISLIDISATLTEEAKSDVELLIEGKLDTDAILSGKLKAPTWEDIEKELEGI